MKNQKHQQAYNLFFQTNLSQAQIAKTLDINAKTLYNWLSAGKWRQQKKLAAHMPSKIVEQQYYMLANLGHEILGRGHQPYPLTHEGEQMRKIALTIRQLKNRQTVNEAMESYIYLAESIAQEEPELAARIMPYIQRHVQGRVDVKFADLAGDDVTVDPAIDEMYNYEVRPFDDDYNGGITTPADASPANGPVAPVRHEATPEPEPAEVEVPLHHAASSVPAPALVSNTVQPPANNSSHGQIINTPLPIIYWWKPGDTDTTCATTFIPDKPIPIAA